MFTLLDWACGAGGSSSGSASASSKSLPSSLFCLLLLLKAASNTAARPLVGGTISRLTLLDLDNVGIANYYGEGLIKVALVELDQQTFYFAWEIG